MTLARLALTAGLVSPSIASAAPDDVATRAATIPVLDDTSALDKSVGQLTMSPLAGRLALTPREVAFKLDAPDAPRFSLLLPFRDASIERLGPLRVYTSGRWGRRALGPWLSLPWVSSAEAEGPSLASFEPGVASTPTFAESDDFVWGDDADASASPRLLFSPRVPGPRGGLGAFLPSFTSTGNSLRSGGFDVLFRLPEKPVADWRCRRQPVTFLRYGNESDRIELVRCDGSVAPFALDKLTLVARPPEVPRPEAGLPDEPDDASWKERREWLPGIRIVHPRLLWALQKIADAFPRRGVYVYSGYRPFAEVNDGSHHRSQHATGRAMDIGVMGIAKEELFKVCRTLKDVGCGFYPNGKFVHVDVRAAHSGNAFWIDASGPGEPARYVDSWPGVVEAPAGTSAAAGSAMPSATAAPLAPPP